MKRKNLKSLKLNKKSISSLNSSSIKGGTITTLISVMPGVACGPGGTEETCINTHCADGVACDLQTPAPKQ